MIKAYLFDFDGTLVDSMPTFISSILELLDEYGVKHGDGIANDVTPLGADGTAQYMIELGLDLSKEAVLDAIREKSIKAYCDNVAEKPNAAKLLNKLKAEGAQIYMLTANSHIQIDPCLRRLGLFEFFSEIWSCDDLGMKKTDTRIYKRAAEMMGVEAGEVLFFDDNIGALATARAAGMHTCGVYDESSRDYVKQIKETAERYVYDLGELL